MTGDPDPPPRFSVLIPLEFTRGRAEACVRAWTTEQRYPRDRFELLIAAPAHSDAAELALLGSMLGARDQIVSLAADHDIRLVAQAARRVQGEVLVFTEAHCIPEPDFLEACDRAFAEHPEWVGFSGGSKPLVHNLLSEIEAEMYVGDIERNMRQHPWLKVLDQCFVVKRTAYEASGGLDGRFGHFAEHLLAARLHRAGLAVGFDPRAAIRHHYVGEIAELIEFARDYGRGQALYASEAGSDPCGDLFSPPDVWRTRVAGDPAVGRHMTRLLLADLPAVLRRPRSIPGATVPRKRIWLRGFARWSRSAALPRRLRLPLRVLILEARSLHLRAWLGLGNRRRATAAFLALNDAAATLGGAEVLEALGPVRLAGNPNLSQWTATTADLVPGVGFHELERMERLPFRWSEPAAMISIDRLSPGDRITIEWGSSEGHGHERVRLYLNECRVAGPLRADGRRSTTITVDRELAPARLGLSVGPTRAKGDERSLGLPVVAIHWRSSPLARLDRLAVEGIEVGAMRRPHSASVAGADPLYVLHMQKCAGTSLRAVIGNAFAADERLSATHAVYYSHQLEANRSLLDRPIAYATGHFGMDLPAATPDRVWRVMTVLREPVDRFLSLHGYLRQEDFLSRSLPFGRWVAEELQMRDTSVGHLLVGALDARERGLEAVVESVVAREAEATAALRSCVAVGVFERMEDTVNLICAATGALPPCDLPHLNPTTSPTDVAARAGLESPAARLLLEVESRLHRLAATICDHQVAELHAALAEEGEPPLRTAQARARLRERWFGRQRDRLAPDDLSLPFAWLPEDPFAGENMHPLEEHRGDRLRWTGPGTRTVLYVPIDTARRWRLRIALHRASPGDHVAAAEIRVNGRALDHASDPAGDLDAITNGGPVLEAMIQAPACEPSTSPFSLLELISPVRRGEGEFRRLGLALAGILLEPID